jgi:hypothetical protein
MYTIIETAKLNRLDPEAYLRAVIARIADHPMKRIDERIIVDTIILTPWHRQTGSRFHKPRKSEVVNGEKCLGLVVNIIVLWNTLYIDAALQQLRTEGFLVKAEDLARL